MDFHETWYESYATGYHISGILFNFVRWVTTATARTSEEVLTLAPRNLVFCTNVRLYMFQKRALFAKAVFLVSVKTNKLAVMRKFSLAFG